MAAGTEAAPLAPLALPPIQIPVVQAVQAVDDDGDADAVSPLPVTRNPSSFDDDVAAGEPALVEKQDGEEEDEEEGDDLTMQIPLSCFTPRGGPLAVIRAWRSRRQQIPKVIEAARTSDEEFLRRALKRKPALSMGIERFTRRTALSAAAKSGTAQCVRLVLQAALESSKYERNTRAMRDYVNLAGLGGRTALHLACSRRFGKESVEVVNILINANADLTSRDSEFFWTPLHFAYAARRPDAVEALLRAAGDGLMSKFINACDGSGLTPLMLACRSGCTKCVRVLMDHGAPIAMRTTGSGAMGGGSTGMHYAARSGAVDVIWLLVLEHADALPVINHNGWSPLDVSRRFRQGHVATLLNTLWNVEEDGHEVLWLYIGSIIFLIHRLNELSQEMKSVRSTPSAATSMKNGKVPLSYYNAAYDKVEVYRDSCGDECGDDDDYDDDDFDDGASSTSTATMATPPSCSSDDRVCVLCATNDATISFRPCGHTACAECARNVIQGMPPSMSTLCNVAQLKALEPRCAFCRCGITNLDLEWKACARGD